MRKMLAILILLAALTMVWASPPVMASEVDVLINKLVQKGLLTEAEAKALLQEMQKESARQTQTIKDTAQEAAKETAQKTVKDEVKTVKLPSWVEKIKFAGDFRLRYQPQNKELDNGSTDDRWRARYRWRFGATIDPVEKWQLGFRLASGSGDPRSTNQTLTNNFEKPQVRIDLAYVQFQPWEWMKVSGGQIRNPLWNAKDLLWDTDITPEGVAAQFKYKFNSMFTGFLNPAWFLLTESNHGTGTPNMFILQPGIYVKPASNFWFQVAGSWYANSNVKGNNFKYSSGTNTRDKNGDLISEYSAGVIDAELGFDFDNPYVKLFQLHGQFVNSDADDNKQGWLAGFRVGHKVQDFGQWQLWYNYRELQKDAWPDFLPDSDFYDGGTNVKGHNAQLRFGLAKNVWFDLEYYRSEILDIAVSKYKTHQPENLWQFDLNVKF